MISVLHIWVSVMIIYISASRQQRNIVTAMYYSAVFSRNTSDRDFQLAVAVFQVKFPEKLEFNRILVFPRCRRCHSGKCETPPTTNFTPRLPWIQEKNYSQNKEQTTHTCVEKEGKNAKQISCRNARAMYKENFVQNPWLLDNLVAEDRHEIGCESLESHFHKDWHKAGGTNKGLIFATSDSTAIVTIYVLSPPISTSSATYSLWSSPWSSSLQSIVVRESVIWWN